LDVFRKQKRIMVPPAGIEPATPGLGSQNSKIGLCLEYCDFSGALTHLMG